MKQGTIAWCHNAKTGEVFAYTVGGTDFPRSRPHEFDPYFTTGFASREEAEKSGYVACPHCEGPIRPRGDGTCWRCEEKIASPAI